MRRAAILFTLLVAGWVAAPAAIAGAGKTIGLIDERVAELLGASLSETEPSDNQVLTYDAAAGTWGPEAAAGGLGTSTNFTPTSTWVTNATHDGDYIQVGDWIEVDYRITLTGAPTAASLQLDLPAGFTMDTGRLLTEGHLYGLGTCLDSGADWKGPLYAIRQLTDNDKLRIMYIDVSEAKFSGYNTVNATDPITWGSGDQIHIHARIPVNE